MTRNLERDRVSEIAVLINQYRWRPSPVEVEYGMEFLQLLPQLEGEEAYRRFPRDTRARPWTRSLHTENVVVLAAEVRLLREEFLPRWRERLADRSPMAELVDLYVQGAQPIVRHAEEVLADWEQAVLPEPAPRDVSRHARYSGETERDVAAQLRYNIAASWEKEPARRSLWKKLEPAWTFLDSVRVTMTAAVTGDVEC
ncbi:MAG TPA: hypothetical protein VIU15_32370 [Streptomyces sp.]